MDVTISDMGEDNVCNVFFKCGQREVLGDIFNKAELNHGRFIRAYNYERSKRAQEDIGI
jgi:hypothetical protein